MFEDVRECASWGQGFRAFRVAVGDGFAYWTVLGEGLYRVEDLDGFLAVSADRSGPG